MKKINYTPLYKQVKDELLNQIIKGVWSPGSFLPNEFILAEKFGVSQGTLRKALNELTSEKYLVRYQGKGTAIAIMEENSSLFPFFFLSTRDNKHIAPISQTYNLKKINSDEKIAKCLNIPIGTEILEINRIRILNDEPTINETVYISLPITGNISFEKDQIPNTLYAYYQSKCNIHIIKAHEDIEAVLPTADDIKKLNITKNHPLMMICRTSYNLKGEIVEYRISKINTKNFIYHTELK